MRFLTLLLKNLLRRKTRSVLTIGGVAIAVGTTISLLGASEGLIESAVTAFATRGQDVIVLEKGAVSQLSSDLPEDLPDRAARLPHVAKVAKALVDVEAFDARGETLNAMIQGWEPGAFAFDDLTLLAGRLFRPGDDRVALLGETLAEHLGLQVGDAIPIEGEPFQVVGLFRSYTFFENVSAILPLAALQQVKLRQGRITGFSVVLDPAGKQAGLQDRICREINEWTDGAGASLRLDAKSTRNYVQESLQIKLPHAMAWLTSMIAVFVGAIGVLNTMIMSVAERRREISILRAIGWRKRRVVGMIVGESLLLSLAGAILGALVASWFTRWLTSFPQVAGLIPGDISPYVFVKGFALAALVGLLGGLYPAVRAAWLRPAEGLRYE